MQYPLCKEPCSQNKILQNKTRHAIKILKTLEVVNNTDTSEF